MIGGFAEASFFTITYLLAVNSSLVRTMSSLYWSACALYLGDKESVSQSVSQSVSNSCAMCAMCFVLFCFVLFCLAVMFVWLHVTHAKSQSVSQSVSESVSQ